MFAPDSVFDVEVADPIEVLCACCDGIGKRSAYKIWEQTPQGRLPCAAGHSQYYDAPAHEHVDVLLCIGPWWDTSGPQDRAAFCARISLADDGGYGFRFQNVKASHWGAGAVLGIPVSAQQADAHPLLPTTIAILCKLIAADERLRNFLQRG